ncbi:hypothetical protein PVK06_024518 [Gossypium arboreum]|uniref:Kinetochore protein Spc24 n=1 Tax=Gossypium arboreum TaxID=29729 RepID=A0ABR0PE39_GOSAR|nr:hypothetical protein PVK06_024518 [Gossypium arboreum]
MSDYSEGPLALVVEVSKIISIYHGLWSGALMEADRHYNNKIACLERSITTLKGKLGDAQTEYERYKGEVHHLKGEKSVLEEKLKAQKESHKVELERLSQSHEETFRKFQSHKNLIEVIPEWRMILILYTQVPIGPLDLKRVDLKCVKDISIDSLSFNIYHLEGEEWKYL